MSAGLYDTISINDVISRTKMQLKLTDTGEQDATLEVMINEGLEHINSWDLLVKRQCELTVYDRKAKLPAGFQKFLGLRFLRTNVNSSVNDTRYAQILYVDKKWLKDCSADDVDNSEHFNLGMQIVGGFIHFNEPMDVDTVDLAFYGYNLDDEGHPIIYQRMERALMSYACWKYILAYLEDYSVTAMKEYKGEWIAQKKWLKGHAVAVDFQQGKREMQDIFMALEASKYINY